MKVLFLDPFSGLSGDMFVGALLDLGVDLARLSHELSKLKLGGYRLGSRKVFRGAMAATKFDVFIGETLQKEFDADNTANPSASPQPEHEHSHAHGGEGHSHACAPEAPAPHAHGMSFREIRTLIESSELSALTKTRGIAAFARLAEAEGRIHALPPDDVTFHEVGAIDSIIDFVAVCAGLELLGVDEVWSAPVALGSGGFVRCAHGLMPVPAPATLELAKHFPLRNTAVEKELTTPTGAALVAALATRFCAVPEFKIENIGYGAGAREQQAVPNVLRVVLGTVEAANDFGATHDRIVEMSANIDDATPELLGHVQERLFAIGALDVFFTSIQMKKNRPGTLLTAILDPLKAPAAADIFLKESGTFGIRYATLDRLKLEREIVDVQTRFGTVHIKVGRLKGKVRAVHPEFDDCRRLADEHCVPLAEILRDALVACANLWEHAPSNE